MNLAERLRQDIVRKTGIVYTLEQMSSILNLLDQMMLTTHSGSLYVSWTNFFALETSFNDADEMQVGIVVFK